MLDLVKSSVAARWWNTEQPLTHSLDLSKEGLAMDATQFPGERWLPIPGYEVEYDISNLGRVRSKARVVDHSRSGSIRVPERILKAGVRPDGHLNVVLSRRGVKRTWLVHRLVMLAFSGPCPDGMEVCHNNGTPHDNRLENLRYGTQSDNSNDRVRHGTHNMAARTHCPKGHLYDDENTFVWDGRRNCKACRSEYKRLYDAQGVSRCQGLNSRGERCKLNVKHSNFCHNHAIGGRP